MEVLDPAFYRAVAANGSVGAGEAYMDGLWRCDDLVGLVRLLVRNRNQLDGLESGAARAGAWCLRRVARAPAQYPRRQPPSNIAAHYDSSNEFFALFLSPDLMYSSALWNGEGDTLEAASVRKLERICRQARSACRRSCVSRSARVGAASLSMPPRTTAAMSRPARSRASSMRYASEHIRARGLGDRVRVLLTDYRDLTGQFDKLVSIEMIEAVGADYLEVYFATVAQPA